MRAPFAAFLLVAFVGFASADDPTHDAPDPTQPRVVTLQLSPAAEPRPSLKYELLPTTLERTPGNAASYYYRAVVALRMVPEDLAKEEANWASEFGPDAYDRIPRERLRRWVDAHQRAIDELRRAALRERCDWDLRMQDLRGVESLTYIIEEFQQLRSVIRPLNLRERLAIDERKYDEAYDLLRTHYQAARDVAQQPNLICGLVGVAFASLANDRVEQWIGSPDAPNLYWALAALPRPVVGLRSAIDQERALPWRLFPFLADAETASRSKEEWQRLFVAAARDALLLASDAKRPSDAELQALVLATAARGYPLAKRALIDAGFDRARLEEMPVGQVIAIHLARDMRETYDRLLRTFYLPYPQALAWSARAQRELAERRQALGSLGTTEVLPIADLLLPALTQVLRAEVRTERNLAALQTLEAIRMHLAVNGGRLPESLDEIRVAPVPHNPATQQPFPYRLDAGHAVLEVPVANDEPASVGRKYVLRVRPPAR